MLFFNLIALLFRLTMPTFVWVSLYEISGGSSQVAGYEYLSEAGNMDWRLSILIYEAQSLIWLLGLEVQISQQYENQSLIWQFGLGVWHILKYEVQSLIWQFGLEIEIFQKIWSPIFNMAVWTGDWDIPRNMKPNLQFGSLDWRLRYPKILSPVFNLGICAGGWDIPKIWKPVFNLEIGAGDWDIPIN